MSTAEATDSWGRTLSRPDTDEVELLEYVTGLAQPSASFPGQRVLPLDLTDAKQRQFFVSRFGDAAELGRFFPRKQQVFDATAAWQARNGVAIAADGVHRPAGALPGLPRFAAWREGRRAATDGTETASAWAPALFLSAYGYHAGEDGSPAAGAAAVLTVPGGVLLQELVLEIYDRDGWRPVAATSSGPSTGAVLSLGAEGALAAPSAVSVLATAYYVASDARFAIPVLVTAELTPPAPTKPATLAVAEDIVPDAAPAPVLVDGVSASLSLATPTLSLAVGVPQVPKLAVTVTDPVHKISPPGGPVRIGINREGIVNDCDYYYAEPWVTGVNIPSEVVLALTGSAAAPQGSWFDAATPSNLNGSLVLVCRGGSSPGGVMSFPSSEIYSAVTISSGTLAWRFDPAESAQTPFWNSSDVLDLYFTLNFAMNGGGGGYPNASLTVTSDATVQSSAPNVALVSQLQFVWGCVAADALVRMADGSPRRIDQVRIGETVRADADGRVLRVANVTRGHDALLRELETDDGMRVRVTEGHPLVTADGWTVARDLAVGDAVETETGFRRIVSIDTVPYGGEVRNLVLAPVEGDADGLDAAEATFFAGGIRMGDNRLQGRAARMEMAAASAAVEGWTDDAAWRHDVANFRRLAAGQPLVAVAAAVAE